jgi:colanic acid/amylovoran biosynthesis glycosyltransferase
MSSSIESVRRSERDISQGRKLKILMVVEKFPEISNPFILNQITGLIDLGHDVSIFSQLIGDQRSEHSEINRYQLRNRLYAFGDTGQLKWGRVAYFLKNGATLLLTHPKLFFSSINLFSYGSQASSLRLFLHINSAVKIPDRDFDIIHAQFGPLGAMMSRLRNAGVVSGKLVTHFRGYDATLLIHSYGRDYYDELFASGDMFLAVCNYIKHIIIELGSPKEKTFVHYSGVEVDNFPYHKRGLREANSLHIGSVGRLSSKKGYEYVIKALSILKSEGFDFTYEIIGDGELKNEIIALIDHYGLNQNVVMLGGRNHDYIIGFLRRIDVFISHNVTSDKGDQEGIANTLKEAMLSGVPVFTTYHAGIPELVKNGTNGFLTEEKSIDQLVDVLKKRAFSSGNLENLTLNARETAIEMFDNKKLNKQLVRRYDSLLHEEV